MIGEFNNNLQIASLVLSIIGQIGFVWMYSRVEWYRNYVGRALFAKSLSLLLLLCVSFIGSLYSQPPFTHTWVSPLITFADWTVTLAIMLQWRALWRQQHDNDGKPVR